MFPHLNVMARDGSARRDVSTGVELNASPSFSPDGKRIVFAGSQSGNPDIFVVDADWIGPEAADDLACRRIDATLVAGRKPDSLHLERRRNARSST